MAGRFFTAESSAHLLYPFLFWLTLELLRWLSGKESPCQCWSFRWYEFHPWIKKIPWRRKWQSTPVFLPGESHGLRNLVVYSPLGHKELNTNKHACVFNWHLGCSHVLATINSAAMSSTVFIYHFRPCLSLNIYLGVGLLVKALFLVFKKPSYCAPQWFYQLTLPPIE